MSKLARLNNMIFIASDLSRIYLLEGEYIKKDEKIPLIEELPLKDHCIGIMFKNGTSEIIKGMTEEQQLKLQNELCALMEQELSQPKKKTTLLSWLGLKRNQS